ncbi:chemotaxis protein CheB [Frigidibacter sp. MR17.24]|uniref:chemotaxis protein CheB n=1 Tax=Frigidibacter sp. MR17.24 TaxID=3127345 RepID=UPI003012AD4A
MTDTRPKPGPATVPVCAIGASAGGVTALRALFSQLPPNLGLAYVVIIHLPPDRPSQLHQILSEVTGMPVVQVDDTPELRPDTVFVIPPDSELVIEGDAVTTREFIEPRGRREPINRFFRSIAKGRGDGMAVLLSGGGSDGAAGARAVKEAGGVILAQEPAEAEFPMMPRAVIQGGGTDVVGPIATLARRIAEIAATKHSLRETAPEIAEPVYREILTLVRDRTGHDFLGYKDATVRRRIARRMQITRSASLPDYAQRLRSNADEAQELFSELLISVTSFFRDPQAWDQLSAEAVAQILEAADEGGIRAWVVGCATGEEAYSLAMLLLEAMETRGLSLPVQIFATDVDETALVFGREGRYGAGIAADVGERRLQRFFERDGEGYRVRKVLRDCVLFARHSLMRDPPFMRLDLVSCRNLLIYLNRGVQRDALGTFAYGLRRNGYLFLGLAENPDLLSDDFLPVERSARIYRLRTRAVRHFPARNASPQGEWPRAIDSTRTRTREGQARGFSETHAAALEQFAPPSVLVAQDLSVQNLSPLAGRYLLPSAGPLNNNIASLVRPELRLDLRAAIRRAVDRGEPTLTAPVPVAFDAGARSVALHVAPTAGPEGQPAVLILFLDGGPVLAGNLAEVPDQPAGTEIRRLRAELESAEARAVTAGGEYEVTLENLRIANEELQSVNEEYRSTAEELEASREELQSTNVELEALNRELEDNLTSIRSAHSDLENVIAASDIGTLFLDTDLKIRMVTLRVKELFNVTEGDTGRRITDFNHRLTWSSLPEDVAQVLADLQPIERELPTTDGRWLQMRLRPYRTIDDHINGVVLTFVDVTSGREALTRLRESEARANALARATAQVIYRMSADWSEMLELSGDGFLADCPTPDAGWLARYIHPEDRPQVDQAILHALREKRVFELEHRVIDKDGGIGWTLSRAVPILNADGEIAEWFGAASDLTARKRHEEELRATRDALAMATRASRLGWGSWDYATGQAEWDARARQIIGLAAGEGRIDDWMTRLSAEDRAAIEDEIAASLREGRAFEVEFQPVAGPAAGRIVHATGMFQSGDEGTAAHGTGLVRDVTELRRWEARQRMLVGELNHRVKNLLAVIQSIAAQTRRGSTDLESFGRAFEQRLSALAAGLDTLTRSSWTGTDLAELIEMTAGALRPGEGRLSCTGEPVTLAPDAVLTLALALHELATNALKYGAWSCSGGKVAVDWAREGEDLLRLRWRETGGPRPVPPDARGFGSALLETGVAWDLDGNSSLEFADEGVIYTLVFPVPAAG